MCPGKLKKMFKPKMPEPPPMPEQAQLPTPDNEEVKRAQELELIRARNARGRTSTLLTGGAGDETEANIGVKKLLGS